MIKYDIIQFAQDCNFIANTIKKFGNNYDAIYGIPQGGIPFALKLSEMLGIPVLGEIEPHDPSLRVLVVDDLIDSGTTLRDPKYQLYDKAVLCIKPHSIMPDDVRQTMWAREVPSEWIHFWWEPQANLKDTKHHIIRLLEYIGENPNREGLVETPDRVIKSYNRLYGGYKQKPEEVMKVFKDGACDEMVVLKDITMFSTCEHHMLPFYGTAHIGYIPDKKVIGVSKLARLLDIYARRLQIQERIGQQVTQALMDHLQPHGAACVIKAKHFCMTSRGVEQQTTEMVTSSLTGVFRDKPEARAEFMSIIQ